MTMLTIRRLDPGVKERLRVRAAEHGRSMEEEARADLERRLCARARADQCLRRFAAALRRPGRGRTRPAAADDRPRAAELRVMHVFDTNVLSEIMRAEPDAAVAAWLQACPVEAMYTTVVSQTEILYGVRRLPDGGRRVRLAAAAHAMFAQTFAGRVLPFDGAAAAVCADIRVARARDRPADRDRGRDDRRRRPAGRGKRRHPRRRRLRRLRRVGGRSLGGGGERSRVRSPRGLFCFCPRLALGVGSALLR